jgi:hypothetical protein
VIGKTRMKAKLPFKKQTLISSPSNFANYHPKKANIQKAMHFLRISKIDSLNLENLLDNGYSHLNYLEYNIFNDEGIRINIHAYELPSPEIILMFQLLISCLEKYFKAILAYYDLLKKIFGSGHSIKNYYIEIPDNNLVTEKNTKKQYPIKWKFANYKSLLDQIFEMDYIILRYEGFRNERDFKPFEIKFMLQDIKDFSKFLEDELSMFASFLYWINGGKIEYPNTIKPIHVGFHKNNSNSEPFELISNPDFLTLSNKKIKS